MDVETLKDLIGPREHGIPVNHRLAKEALFRKSPEKNVLCNGKLRDKTQFLMHSDDPALERVMGRPKSNRVSVDEESTARGSRCPRNDLYERALAGTVLADESMNLAAGKCHADIVQRDGAGILLAEGNRLQTVGRSGHADGG
jgi:hypothetical protein